jgi:flagellar biogenesis protein FliO
MRPRAHRIRAWLFSGLLLAHPGWCETTATEPSPAAPTAAPAIPFKTDDAILPGELRRVYGVLLVALLLAAAAAYALKRLQLKHPMLVGRDSRIEVIESKRLSTLLTLHLVRVEGARYLLAQSGNQVVLLEKLGTQQEEAPP